MAVRPYVYCIEWKTAVSLTIAPRELLLISLAGGLFPERTLGEKELQYLV